MNNLSKKSLGLSKYVITFILCCNILFYGCHKKDKHVSRLSTCAYLAELEQQERTYKDSLNKCCALLDTAHINYYMSLYTSNAALRQEANSFISEVENEKATSERSSLTTTERVLIYVVFILLIALLICLSIVKIIGTRIGWFFQDIWRWFKANTSVVPSPCFGKEDLNDEDIHEIMNIIHHCNPQRNGIKQNESMNE